MRHVFLIVLIGVCGVYSHVKRRPSYKDIIHPKKSSGNNPCQIEDIDCMRHFLSSNSHCFKSHKQLKDSVAFHSILYNIPAFNTTVISPFTTMHGLKSAKIVEFSTNSATKNVVIGITLTNLKIEDNEKTLFYIQRRAKESIIVPLSFHVTLPAVTLTAVIPSVPHLRLMHADMHAFFDKAPQDLHLGSGDQEFGEEVQKVFDAMQENPTLIIQERMIVDAPLIVNYIIQTLLCNFGFP